MGVPPMSIRGILPLPCHGQDARGTHGRDGRATKRLTTSLRATDARVKYVRELDTVSMSDRSTQRRAKVCVLTSVHMPFDGRVFHKEARSLARAGYEVVLIARHDKEETIGGVRIVPLPEPKSRLHRMTQVLWRLYRLAVKEDADVYHFHDPELMVVGLLLKLRGRRVIWDVHEHYPNAILDKYYLSRPVRRVISRSFDIFERAVVRFFDYVIYTTPFVGARYEKLKVRSGRIENYPIIELSQTFERDPQEKIIYLGGMSRTRGLVEVAEAFTLVTQKHPSWELYLVGLYQPKSFEQELRELVQRRGIAGNVRFMAWVPYEEKERLSSQASMGIITYLPYANNTSCLPNKLFDYMLVGLPVIASNFPLYREVVEPNGGGPDAQGRCGLIVDPSKPEEIARAMEYLIEHPQEARRMGQNGRRAVLEKYNWEKESERLLRIYDAVLNTEK
jgi:glycosyltransferase involved in cell wall biosynthesis